jgi:type II secretory pathway pseudopilin PulG
MIEMLFVIVIIGILAAIAIPMYLHSRDSAKDAAARDGGRIIMVALLSYVQDSTADDPWPANCTPAILSGYLSTTEWPKNPFVTGQLMQEVVTGTTPGDFAYVPVVGTSGHIERYHVVVFQHDSSPFTIP